jgi:hypothetical protein
LHENGFVGNLLHQAQRVEAQLQRRGKFSISSNSIYSKYSNPFYDKRKHAKYQKSSRCESPTSSSSGKEKSPPKKPSSKGKDVVSKDKKVKQSNMKCF